MRSSYCTTSRGRLPHARKDLPEDLGPVRARNAMAGVTVADGTAAAQRWASPDRQRGFRSLADAVPGTPARTSVDLSGHLPRAR
jgi:hypothetical protein